MMSKFKVCVFAKVSLFLGLTYFVIGCALAGTVTPAQAGDLADDGKVRVVKPGDHADIRYLCKLPSGEVAATTEHVAEDRPKSSVFLPRDKEGPLSVTAAAPIPELPPGKELAFEDEIAYRLADLVAGMKEGERRELTLTAQDVMTRSEKDYVTLLSRVRKRPKEMKMVVGDYQVRTGKPPKVGDSFAYDPAFPGRVEAVTDQEVVIRFPNPGDVIQTPLGPGHVRETENIYEVRIDARKGALIRVAEMVGCISDVDDRVITLDFRNPFGRATLICDVTIEKVSREEPMVSSTEK
ncbi:MAG TPA: hypothetical protein VMV04_15175 [Thermodesulfobacteriota bacterium]|nr:hypothetical protein [Thermodesulfobacteriota bacterium]